ncbi:very-long-chain 3-oxoacyl-CoA reductase-B-like [Gastrophryne carolinensis]
MPSKRLSLAVGKCVPKKLLLTSCHWLSDSEPVPVASTERQTDRKTRLIQADFTGGLEIYTKIEKELKDLDIGILGSSHLLDALWLGGLCDIVNCNMLSTAQMTRIVLPNMISRKKGLIINMSSEAGSRPYPYMTIYSATKGFVDYFSRALHTEYQSKGIIVQCVMPLLVSTNLTENVKTNILVKTPEEFAREALNTVGLTNRTSGCLSHSIQSYFLHKILPNAVLSSGFLERMVLDDETAGGPCKPKDH